ncbi:secretion system protein E [Rubrivivax gelatinosus]|nr:secretion system protein E [Rubrivivax gelatinosus]
MAVHEAALVNAGVQAGLVDAATVSRLRPLARAQRLGLLDAIGRELRLPPTAFWQALARQRGLPWLDLGTARLDDAAFKRLPVALLQKHAMMPMLDEQGREGLAVCDPDDRAGAQVVARLLGREPRLMLADAEGLAALLQRETGRGPTGAARAPDEDATALLDRLVRESLQRRATDIHVEAVDGGHQLRLRVDGVLQDWGLALPRALGEALVSRIKVLAGLDISEARAPQDGGVRFAVSGWDGDSIDLRVASMPTCHGERLTLRLLGQGGTLTLDALGMPEAVLEPLRAILARPHGILLVTGPTGSGKSTTLYAALRELDSRRLNILTVEDPVEQQVAGISQVGVSTKVGFADALRAFLRHDPDIILVGEVRDADTADTALKAAATGHLVLSTLHTNSAAGAVTRLVDIGCERYMIADTLAGVLAQRLVRRLCTRCREPAAADTRQLQALGLEALPPGAALHRPVGCPHCLGSGYRGRIGLYEALWMDAALAEAVAEGARERRLAALAHERGTLYALADDARAKLLAGLVGFDDVRPFLRGGA